MRFWKELEGKRKQLWLALPPSPVRAGGRREEAGGTVIGVCLGARKSGHLAFPIKTGIVLGWEGGLPINGGPKRGAGGAARGWRGSL